MRITNRQAQLISRKKFVTRLTIGLLAMTMIMVSCLTLVQKSAQATSLAAWNPGRIIDDVIMTNKDSMTVGQIQNFLNSKVPACDTSGQQLSEYGGPDLNGDGKVQRWEWGQANYGQKTFPCLKDYSENGISAAQIIYNSAQKYTINPQVLIVLLQKEQGLVTDTWPLNVQYKTATGYGCPDTAPCDAQYYGLTNQLDWSATMFRAIQNNSPTWYTPYILGNNYIQWSPNSSCGGSTVNIQNRATQALYNYTPYQPNQAALNAGYANGDGCSAYGNRNFYLYFNDWFGLSIAPNYAWQSEQQTAYADASKTQTIDTNNLIAGQRYYFVIKARNSGNTTWKKGVPNQQVNLGTSRPIDRHSSLCDSTWLNSANCDRIATTTEAEVAPGEIGTFEFWVKPSKTGRYDEYLNLVADGVTWLNDQGLYWTVSVQPQVYSWQPAGQSSYTDQNKTQGVDTSNLSKDQRYYLVIKAKNTGNMTWKKGVGGQQVNVGTSRNIDRRSSFCDSTWLNPTNCDRLATSTEAQVAPGEVGTFEFWVKPSRFGTTDEYFNLVADGTTWLNDPGLYWTLKTPMPNFKWQPTLQSAYTDSTKATPVDTTNLTVGQRYYLVIKAKNTGSATWVKGALNQQVNLGTSRPIDRHSSLCDGTWLNAVDCNRLATTVEPQVVPGDIGTFEFWITVTNSWRYDEYFNLVADGVTWLNDPGLYWTIKGQ